MEEQNYFDLLLQDVVNILNNDTIAWPDELSYDQRKELTNKLIAYYKSREEYEKCKLLEKVLDSLSD